MIKYGKRKTNVFLFYFPQVALGQAQSDFTFLYRFTKFLPRYLGTMGLDKKPEMCSLTGPSPTLGLGVPLLDPIWEFSFPSSDFFQPRLFSRKRNSRTPVS